MGLWEEAQKQHRSELERQAKDRREGQRYRASAVQAEQLAVREFIDGMSRLGIAPQRLRFWKYSSWSQRYKMTSHSVFGWNIDSPRQPNRGPGDRAGSWHGDRAMTPDGLVYSLLLNGFQDRQPWDMSEAHSFTSRDGDTTWSLRDVLQGGLYEAIRGS